MTVFEARRYAVNQALPAYPGQNVLQAVDSVNQSLYTAMANDPIIGVLAKALPPPPKISALMAEGAQVDGGSIEQAGIPGLPGLPAFPTLPLPAARQGIAAPSAPGGRVRNPFT